MKDPADQLKSPEDLTIPQLRAFLSYYNIPHKASMKRHEFLDLVREHNLG